MRRNSRHIAANSQVLLCSATVSKLSGGICGRFFWSSWHAEFTLSSCFRELLGTVCKSCLVSFLEFPSCLCVDELRPKLSLRAPHQCAKRLRRVSHVINVAASRVLLR